jgi:hypothetical protein
VAHIAQPSARARRSWELATMVAPSNRRPPGPRRLAVVASYASPRQRRDPPFGRRRPARSFPGGRLVLTKVRPFVVPTSFVSGTSDYTYRQGVPREKPFLWIPTGGCCLTSGLRTGRRRNQITRFSAESCHGIVARNLVGPTQYL